MEHRYSSPAQNVEKNTAIKCERTKLYENEKLAVGNQLPIQVYLSLGPTIRWLHVVEMNKNSPRTSLISFRNSFKFPLFRLENKASWYDVNKHVHEFTAHLKSKKNPGVVIHGYENILRFRKQKSLVLVAGSIKEEEEWRDVLRVLIAPLKFIQDTAIFIARNCKQFEIRLDNPMEEKFHVNCSSSTKILVDESFTVKFGNLSTIMSLSKDNIEKVLEGTKIMNDLVRFCFIAGAAFQVIAASIRLAYMAYVSIEAESVVPEIHERLLDHAKRIKSCI